MIFTRKNVVAYLSLSTMAFTVSADSSARDLTVCDTFKACYLINIQTRQETVLTGKDSFELDPSNQHGYSIRCDVNGEAKMDFIKFSYNGEEKDEFGEPRFMNGDADMGNYINDVKYLSTCGVKTLKIEGNVWSNPCFVKEFEIDVRNAGGKPCISGDTKAPVMAPVATPVAAPVIAAPAAAPVKPPTMAPLTPPTKAPTTPPTKAPITPPTKAPITPPTKAPITPPTKAPIKSPTKAPVKPPTKAPVKPPTKSPVKPPTRAPIKTCPHPQQLVNGICKCPYPKELVNGVCKDVCKNDYICPSNSRRIENASCYDSFDDCKCKDGYYKSTREDKCLPAQPVKPPTRHPIMPPTRAPIKTCPYPQQLVNGVCKAVCKNDYICPANSCRIEHASCYDSFDDCKCNYGYYKSTHENKCLRHSWCYW